MTEKQDRRQETTKKDVSKVTKKKAGYPKAYPRKKTGKEEVVEKPKATRKAVSKKGQTTTKKKTTNKKNTDEVAFRFKSSPLKIIPLGGLLEVGKNITVFEYENEIVIIDCGLAFPEDDMLGVDLVIPDITYLEKNKEKIKGLVITHGHEDHIGAIPYLLKQINIPIYATKLTAGLIRNKLEEHKLVRSTKLNIVSQGEKINLGKLKVELIRSCHSIPDSVALAIHTPVGVVVHTGDFKIDYTPKNGFWSFSRTWKSRSASAII